MVINTVIIIVVKSFKQVSIFVLTKPGFHWRTNMLMLLLLLRYQYPWYSCATCLYAVTLPASQHVAC